MRDRLNFLWNCINFGEDYYDYEEEILELEESLLLLSYRVGSSGEGAWGTSVTNESLI